MDEQQQQALVEKFGVLIDQKLVAFQGEQKLCTETLYCLLCMDNADWSEKDETAIVSGAVATNT